MEKRESRDENNVCRNWIQMVDSCRRCIFEVLCAYQDMKNEQTTWDNE